MSVGKYLEMHRKGAGNTLGVASDYHYREEGLRCPVRSPRSQINTFLQGEVRPPPQTAPLSKCYRAASGERERRVDTYQGLDYFRRDLGVL